MRIYNCIKWLCGLWSLGLGWRLFIELHMSGEGTYVCIAVHPLNLYFDFGMLAILGTIVGIVETYNLIRRWETNDT